MRSRYLPTFIFGISLIAAIWTVLLRANQPLQTGPATEKRFPPLKLPPGFKATLFACDPLIEYPSVIAPGPRPGAIYVAFDYMTGLGSDGKVKSEIRLVEDTDGDGYADKATVVAKGFNSIQGLAYHDDTLFVMHAPFLTAVRNAKQQHLLTGLGLKPADNFSRLHCANGVTVGHDGWLYLAMGDNGVNVPRPEGDRLIHNGGAILRCRADGRDLHVFSTGLRNIYDIALDAELNVFTRDNENDGGTYMIRVCHAFHGSDHGYPYDYYERPDQAMKPIGDFGLGSSAGGVCYLETKFPPAYRGNLFFCEWGKSVVRYELKRSTSGFNPVKEIEFATGDAKDKYPFKPTDVVVQRDGTLMVSDYADGQRPKRGRGRIYQIAFDSNRIKKQPKTDLQKLNSDSYFERCDAQAALMRAGKQPAFAMLKPQGKMHAIWALARTEGAKAIATLLRVADEDPDAGVRAQAVRAIADLADSVLVTHKLDAGRGDAKLAERLAKLGVGANPRVQLEIVITLGRLRWAGAPAWLGKHLRTPDTALAHAAMQTLRRADNWPAVLKLLDKPRNAPIRAIAVRALADQFDTTVVDGLLQRLDADPRLEYADILTRVYKKPGPWKYWGYRPGPRSANTEVWERTQAIAAALDCLLARNDLKKRADVLTRMRRENVPVQLKTLVALLGVETKPDATRAVLDALSNHPPAETRSALDALVRDRRHDVTNRKVALELLLKDRGAEAGAMLVGYAKTLEDGATLADILGRLGALPKHPSAGVIAPRLKSKDAQVRAAALTALGELRAAEGAAFVLPFLKDRQPIVRRAGAGAAGPLGVKEAIEPLLKMLDEGDARLECLRSLTLLREPRVVAYAVASLDRSELQLAALDCLAELGNPQFMNRVVELARRGPSADTLVASVRVLAAWRDADRTHRRTKLDLDAAIGEVHGHSGILVNWHASGAVPLKDRDKIIKIARRGMAPPTDWRALFSSGPEARLTLGSKGDPKDIVRFAIANVNVPAPTPVEFLASSRGPLEVWLNGKSIHRRAKDGKFQIDSDRFSATLDNGANRVLVQTAGNPAEFHLHFRRKSSKAEHERLIQLALSRPGNAGRGSKTFFDKDKSQCLKCHRLGNQGETIGPDLTGVGKRFSRIHIVESLLAPSRTIAPSYNTYAVTLRSGRTLNGVKVAQNEKSVTLADNQGVKHMLPRADIDEMLPSPISIMPDDLEQRLSPDEFVDLIAFLTNQK